MRIVPRSLKLFNVDNVIDIATELSIPFFTAEILVRRGFDSVDKVRAYMSDSLDSLHDPMLLPDMEKAVNRIKEAFDKDEQVLIWGDYDVDGTSAASILYLAFEKAGQRTPFVYIPHRKKEGYGLSSTGRDAIIKSGNVDLVITVDTGITSREIIKDFIEAGVDVIVTDHHEPPELLPICHAVIDAKRKDSEYPFRELCGAGVAFKLVEALFGREFADEFIDIAAFATVADVVPLVDENRVIVKRGLHRFNTNPRLPFQALMEQSMEKGEKVNAYHFGYKLGPMVNACGRLAHAKYAVALMISKDKERVTKLASWMHSLNEQRKEIEDSITEQAIHQYEKDPNHRGIIAHGYAWEEGVIGIVASTLTEKYYKPSIVFSYNSETGIYKGSARSIPGISIYDALAFCSDYILKWGGHDAAAGLSIEAAKFQGFKDMFESYLSRLDDELFNEKKKYDMNMSPSDVSEELVESLNVFEPLGVGNPSVTIASMNVSMLDVRKIGKDKTHFSCIIKERPKDKNIKGVAFSMEPPVKRENIDVLYAPSINEFAGKRNVQLMIKGYIEEREKKYDVTFNENPKDVPLSSLGVSKAKEKQFNNVGIHSALELLNYLPKDYLDYRTMSSVTEWKDKENKAIIGTVTKKAQFANGSGFMLHCKDDKNNFFMVSFFGGQGYAYNMFEVNKAYFFSGPVKTEGRFSPSITPKFWSKDHEKYKRLVPVYKKIPGMSNNYLEEKLSAAKRLLEKKDPYSKEILEQYDICTMPESISCIHTPKNEADIEKGKKRLLFDALFKFALFMEVSKKGTVGVTGYNMPSVEMTKKVKSELPYKLTSDQERVLSDISSKLSSGNKLNGLLQGDVGCGKTIVALLTMIQAVENGYQACMIAPTEVLAQQHYEDFKVALKPYNISLGFLSGSLKAKAKKEMSAKIKSGEVDIAIGTHALIQDSVEFNNLGLIVIDEQHKFGVVQREKLAAKSEKPHVITMSATPIPRTLSIALLGNHIDVFTIYEKPAGRKEVITKLVKTDSEANKFMLREIKKGHQCYVVCPLIEDSSSDKMKDVESVDKTVAKMKKYFEKYPEVKISDISGKLSATKIQKEIEQFKDGKTNILISTTIVEVGVNVPNASVMLLKSSERFGLAQAHQLRGRVGRGNDQGYLLLQTKPGERKAEALLASSDGFEIAKKDLDIRGSGDFLGTKQSGQNNEVLLVLANQHFFEKIQKEVSNISDTEDFAMYVDLLNI